MALQSENFVLEKQLHSYQQSLAKNTEKEKEKEKEREKEKEKYPSNNVQPYNAVDKSQSRETRYNERVPTSSSAERKSSRDESGYSSDRTSSYYNEKMGGYYGDKPRNDRPKNESRRSSSSREGQRDRNYDRSSSNERMSYRYR